MNANFFLPTLTSTYANFLTEMKSRDEDIATWFDATTSTNIPVNTKRWNATGNKFEKWNGTVWSNLSTLYEIKVRDSDRLNGQAASYYATSDHGHTNATTSVAGFMSSTDKSKLDAIAANANNYSHPTGDGNLHVPANGTANSGKFLQATGVAGSYVWANVPTVSLSGLGVNATAAELNILDGATVTTSELNYLEGVSSSVQTQLKTKAPLASPAFTGTPTSTTPDAGDNSGRVATTAFVLANSLQDISFTAGTKLEALAASEVGFVSTTYIKKKEISVGTGGTITVSFRLKSASAVTSYAAYGQIYVNGVAVGTVRTTTSKTYVTYTQDITVAAGDLVQLYVKGGNVEYLAFADQFKILVAAPSTSTVLLN